MPTEMFNNACRTGRKLNSVGQNDRLVTVAVNRQLSVGSGDSLTQILVVDQRERNLGLLQQFGPDA